jgi:RimJ/RimL family protein N-acetyltransferase
MGTGPAHIKFRMVTSEDEDKIIEHVRRERKEAGREGDIIFGFESNEPFDEDGWRKRFNENHKNSLETPGWIRFLVATDGEDIIGGVNLKTEKLLSCQHRASLGIALEQPYRNQGLGRQLMETRLEWIDLGVFATNPRALALYKSMAFVEWGRCQDRFRVDEMPIDDISMSLKLYP